MTIIQRLPGFCPYHQPGRRCGVAVSEEVAAMLRVELGIEVKAGQRCTRERGHELNEATAGLDRGNHVVCAGDRHGFLRWLARFDPVGSKRRAA